MKKGNLSQALIGFVAAALVFTASADAATPPGTAPSHEQTVVQSLVDQGARISHDPHSGRVSFIGTNPGRALAVAGMAAGQAPRDNARAALNRYAGLFGIADPGTELRSMRQVDTPDGRSMVRYQQLYQGLPVIGGEIIVNMDSGGRMSSMNGEAMPGLALDSTPMITAAQAHQRAVDSIAAFYKIDASLLAAATPTLSVYAPSLIGPQNLGATLVWQLEVESGPANGIDEYVLVDAKAGHIALHFSRVDTVKDRKTYDGSGVTVDANGNLVGLPGTLLCNESAGDNCTGGADLDADDAQAYAGDTYDFYKNNFGRDSIDGNGMTIVSSVHFAYGCPNAFWWPPTQQMVYCDGMPEADDVVGHELTHGVTEHTSNLFYYYQSGAIDESMSDVFGEFIDLTNGRGVGDNPSVLWPSGTRWALGEGSSIGVIRFMWDPTVFSQPDKMSSTYYATGSSDNGGVHTNSGINNHAAALMVDGGTFNSVPVTGIGISKAAQIYYEVETHLLTSGADYYDLYNDLYQGCLNLVGTHGITNGDCTEVRNATLAVEMDLQPTGAANPDADLCPTAGEVPSNLFFDGFEGGNLNNWTLGGSNSSSVWSIDATWTGPYAAGGLHSLYADDVALSNDSYATMKNGVTIPAGGMYLHFDHAFGFDSGGDGGARLLYSTNGTNFSDASTLFDSGGTNPGQTYNGTATAGAFSGLSAFVNDSHGYVGSRYYIPDTKGSKIWFRWELATGTAWNQGWWIDNVRLYTCVANSAPSAPQLISPTINSVNVASSSVTFSWEPSTDADGDTINYQLAVCTDAAFTSCVVNITKSNASRPFTAAAMGGGGGLFLLSLLLAGRRRRIGAILGILVLVGLLSACGAIGPTTPSSISYTASLSPGTTYYWHVTAVDSNGATAVSSDWNFTTAP